MILLHYHSAVVSGCRIGALVAFATGLLCAQPLPIPAAQGVARAVDNGSAAQSLAAAKRAAAMGDLAAAQRSVVKTSPFRENSKEWHRDASQRVAALAKELARDGKRDAVPVLASAALDHLAKADGPALSKRRRAALRTSEGRIHEDLTGDTAAALRAYEEALTLNPDDVSTGEAYARLKSADAKLRNRIKPKQQ